jgi:nicotinamide phosphoribosyltransferase
MSLKTSIIERTDAYKPSHWKQYPAGAEFLHSYLESRGGQFPYTIFFGLQHYLLEYMQGVQVTQEAIDRAEALMTRTFGTSGIFNRAGWEHIGSVHGGRLPLRIRAVPEGTEVPTGNALFTIENTDKAVPWLTNYVESILLKVWYPTTVATLSHAIKKVILEFLVKTGNPLLIDYALQDFGYRGTSSDESAQIGGAANLLNFSGTDTLLGVRHLEQYYGARPGDFDPFSIPAAEHSTITSWGREHEGDAYENMLDQFPGTPVAVVSDSYDIFHACQSIWGERLRDKVLRRTFPLIVRPDSGEPKTVLLRCLEILGEKFGYTVNSKGYKVLCPKIRLIQGDGVNYWSIIDILTHITGAGWSADNLAFGMGGKLLQGVDRDTQKFATKASSITIDGVEYDVQKDPITDTGKRSKAGVLALITNIHGEFQTIRRKDIVFPMEDQLVTVFEDGYLVRSYDYAAIRSRASASFAGMLTA